MPTINLVTIGVFGFTETAFFEALQQARVDTLCDIRWRRGVRGSEYSFVNSVRLQRKLAQLGIRYLHSRELAPMPALRQRQSEADKAEGIAKRKRTMLSEAFIAGYRAEHLANFDASHFLAQVGAEAGIVALFCVEREPGACHRSLLAEHLRQQYGLPVQHLLPGGAPSRKS